MTDRPSEDRLLPSHIEALNDVLREREHEKQANVAAAMRRKALNSRVRRALAVGVPARLLASRLEVSVQRVYQMRDEVDT